jgi:hypothetical protein
MIFSEETGNGRCPVGGVGGRGKPEQIGLGMEKRKGRKSLKNDLDHIIAVINIGSDAIRTK